MESDDQQRWTTRMRNWNRKMTTLRRIYGAAKNLLGRGRGATQTHRQSLGRRVADVYGMTCNNAYALPKTTSDLCRQEIMEKRLRGSRFCCQARRVQVAAHPLQQQQQRRQQQPQPPPLAIAPSTSCINCPPTLQTRAPGSATRGGNAEGPSAPLSNGAMSRSLPCQALPPPPPPPPQCPPCPPCPPTLSTPLKASDYIHTTTECYPNNAKEDPCRWDNTSCYNEGNDLSGNTIRQWNTRCQFASTGNGPNACVGNGSANGPAKMGSAAVHSRVVPSSATVNGGGGVSDAAVESDSNRRTVNGGRANTELLCSHERCRTALTGQSAGADHCFRKCKKELTIHFPSGKCGTQPQLRRSAKLSALIMPRPSMTTARPDMCPGGGGVFAAARSTTMAPPNVANDLLAESPMSTTRAPLLTTPLTPLSPISASATSVRYRPQISLIDDDMPPLAVPRPQVDASIFTNRASQLRWLQNQRKLYMPANKRSITETETTTPTAAAHDFYKNDFDWARVKR